MKSSVGRSLTVGSLFSGIGGFDLGLERAGMQVKWQVEIDPYCQRVLAKHWPHVQRYGDIQDIDWGRLESVDLICGGFPCQPFSTASRGRKTACSLWPEMLRAITMLRPSWVIAENVVGAASLVLKQVVSDLEDIGYQVSPPLEIPACALGYDHKRARYWVLAYTNSRSQSSSPINAETPVLQGRDSNPRGVGKADGVPSRMDRLKGLGNAIVPDIAEVIGRCIANVERRKYEVVCGS